MATTDMAPLGGSRSQRAIWRQRFADARNLLWFVLLGGLFVLRSALYRRRWERARARSARLLTSGGGANQGASGGRRRDMRAMRSATSG
jgi:hypothetical protein